MRQLVHAGANRKDADRIALALGAQITPVVGTGELSYSHPAMPRRVRINLRRKSAGRTLTTWINQLAEITRRAA